MVNLPPEDGRLFYKLYSALMFYANQKLHVLDEPVADAEAYEALPPEPRAKVRNALHDKPELIDQFVRENPASLPVEELDIVASWRQALVGKFYVFRHLKKYTVFLSSGGSPNKTYGVLGLVDPLEEGRPAILCRAYTIKPSESKTVAQAEVWLVKHRWRAWC